ncbi:signal peptidase I [Leucobacter luti]|uniref:signal peptidase I n=1 Tax=Leucobacter luti TaxID=340320 RepID=UPI001C6889EE|nr:signal peptidase I [Leucobacter luti]QYM76314.1 signal peptidase I [Leucobacter luti]
MTHLLDPPQRFGAQAPDAEACEREAKQNQVSTQEELTRGWRIYRGVRNTLLTIGSVIGTVVLLAFGAAILTNTQPTVVLSGSMEPGMPVGSIVLGQLRDHGELRVGDAVTVARPDDKGLITHRVVDIAEGQRAGTSALTLRGDANKVDDPYPYTVTEARVIVGTIPLAGYAALAMQGPAGIATLAFFLCGVVCLVLIDPQRIGETDVERTQRLADRDERRARKNGVRGER